MNETKKCYNCGGQSLSWQPCMVNTAGVADGRLRLNEVTCNFFLGCDDCSETLKIVSADNVAEVLNELRR